MFLPSLVFRQHIHYLQVAILNQIAEKIFVAPDTIKYYRRPIFERLEVTNIADALAQAVNNRLV